MRRREFITLLGSAVLFPSFAKDRFDTRTCSQINQAAAAIAQAVGKSPS
jgi:hypothetical protein